MHVLGPLEFVGDARALISLNAAIEIPFGWYSLFKEVSS